MNVRITRAVGAVLLAVLLSVIIGATYSESTRGGPMPVPPLAQPARGVSQPAGNSDDALLGEVRLIREMLQRTQGNVQREQMVVERIRMHDLRVEQLDKQLTVLRDEIGGTEVHIRQTSEREKVLEAQIEQDKDPNQRQAHEAEKKEMRFAQESQKQRLDRMRERESVISAALQREERALRTLEDRLAALDRELAAESRTSDASNQLGRR